MVRDVWVHHGPSSRMFKGLPFLSISLPPLGMAVLTGNIMAVTAFHQRWGQTVFQPADAKVDLNIFDDDDGIIWLVV